MSSIHDRLVEMQAVEAWTRRVRPIIASPHHYARKVEDLIAAGCSEKNAAYLARMPVREFDAGNNSALRGRAIARTRAEFSAKETEKKMQRQSYDCSTDGEMRLRPAPKGGSE